MNHSPSSLTPRIKQKAHDLGFELVGIAPAHPVPDYDFFRWWLDQGHGATMTYLNRQAERRGDPQKILPGARSILCFGLNYFNGQSGDEIARYAHGLDYHRVIAEKLAAFEGFLRDLVPGIQTKSYVDTGPVLERSYAARAGLGWIGKNTCLINNGLGSFFFLGEILTTHAFEESEYDQPQLDQCGTCTKCLDACPTGALVEAGVLDSRKCVSYLTIEYKGDFSEEQKKMTEGHLYGCDICQDVCPYNERIPTTPLREFHPRPSMKVFFENKKLPNHDEFQTFIEGSAMDRINEHQWTRNCAGKK